MEECHGTSGHPGCSRPVFPERDCRQRRARRGTGRRDHRMSSAIPDAVTAGVSNTDKRTAYAPHAADRHDRRRPRRRLHLGLDRPPAEGVADRRLSARRRRRRAVHARLRRRRGARRRAGRDRRDPADVRRRPAFLAASDLLSVRAIAVPGALGADRRRRRCSGMGLAWLLGLDRRGRARVRPGAVGRQHGGAAARAAGAATSSRPSAAASRSAG